MKYLKSAFITILLFPLSALACMWSDSDILASNKVISESTYRGIVPAARTIYPDAFERVLKVLERLWNNEKDIDYYSDYAYVLILKKEYTKAEKIYHEIEKNQPGRYSTAANLGTAYELDGKNELALQWIKKAIEIFPGSHDSSEWLHVKILESKIQGEKYVNGEHLIGTDFGKDPRPASGLPDSELLRLSNSIFYQLNERMTFVKPQDKIVAQLLFDLGNLALLTKQPNGAIANYRNAKTYGFSDPLIDQRLALAVEEAEAPFRKNEKKIPGASNLVIIFSLAISTAAAMTLFVARIRKKNS